MTRTARASLIGGICGIGAYIAMAVPAYLNLTAHQPPHSAGVPLPVDVASAPPNAAWLAAIPVGIIAFGIAFASTWLFLFLLGSRVLKSTK